MGKFAAVPITKRLFKKLHRITRAVDGDPTLANKVEGAWSALLAYQEAVAYLEAANVTLERRVLALEEKLRTSDATDDGNQSNSAASRSSAIEPMR